MFRHLLQTPLIFSFILGIVCHGVSYAAFDLDAFKTTVTTGAFYTDQDSLDGVVTPWKIEINYKQQLYPHIVLDVSMNSQTGITSGPYIDGFNTQTEPFRIATLKYTQNLSEAFITRLGLGKVKANVLKKGGSITPMPFSNAMGRLPLSASDIAWAIQKTANRYDGAFTLGTAISNISTVTQSDSRTYSLFAEAYRATPQGTVWTQYSQNNLVQIINSDHYFSFGTDYSLGHTVLNGTVYVGTVKGYLGFDCGYKRSDLPVLPGTTLGIGYGYSKTLQSTLEISLQKTLMKNFDATLSWYHQAPSGSKQFNAAGIKLAHTF